MDAIAATRSASRAVHLRQSLRVAVHLFVLSVLSALMVPGCEDDPAGPSSPVATLDNIWPNDDGRAWSFEFTQRSVDSYTPRTYSSPERVPPAPSLDDVAQHLDDPPPRGATTMRGIYRLQFDGMLTTESGATGQNLVQHFEPVPPGKPAGRAAAARPNAAFFARLLQARPELAGRIAAAAPSASGATLDQSQLLVVFLNGGAWAKSDEWIGSYGDWDARVAWKYLESDLSVGHEFSHQLIPAIARDVFLHVRVQRRLTWNTKVGRFANAIECLYLVDYGVGEGSGLDGQPSGYWREIEYGVVVYAPEVGPVYCYERAVASVGETLGPGIGDVTLQLTGTGTAPTTAALFPVKATSRPPSYALHPR